MRAAAGLAWFINLKIVSQLVLAFALLGVLTAGLGAVSLLQLKTLNASLAEINGGGIRAVRSLLSMKAVLVEGQNLQLAALNAVAQGRSVEQRSLAIRVGELHTRYDILETDYLKDVRTVGEQRLYTSLKDKAAPSWEVLDTLTAPVGSSNPKLLPGLIAGERQAVNSTAIQGLDELANVQTEHAAVVGQAAQAAYERANKLVIAGTLATILIGLGLAWILGRALSRPVITARKAAEAIAKGDLTSRFDCSTENEAGQLSRAMQTIQHSLQQFAAAQAEMAKLHLAGSIDQWMPAPHFSGVYGEMAQSINAVIGHHIGIQSRIVEVVSRYGEGDFAPEMDNFPGQTAQVTKAIRRVQTNFQAIGGELIGMLESAAGGDFTARGDANRYQHEFRRLVQALNRVMQVNEGGLDDVAQVLSSIAMGDLAKTMGGKYGGSFGQLQYDVNLTVEQLNKIVLKIREATKTINSVAKEIAAGNLDLSNRTEEQASSLQETATTMGQLTATVMQNAESARQANQLAVGASEIALQGGTAVNQVVTTMRSITESSKKIVEIISVIDAISFQTNILALNAAVEAARAGEQGRGFAVVAAEVRSLAQRSASAAKQIKELIGSSVEKVESGSRLVDAAGRTMGEIVSSVKRVTNIMGEITAASMEQSAGVEQVNKAVAQMDQATQQNAALVEQSAAAAASMEEEARSLAQMVSIFTLSAVSADKPIRLGFAQTGPEGDWREANTESIKAAAEECGVDLLFSDGQQRQDVQIKAIRSFIAQRVDVIALSAVVTTGWDKVLQEAKDAKISVILLGRNVDVKDPSTWTTFIGSDYVEEGRRAGRWLVERSKNTKTDVNIAELQGTVGSAPAINRKKGFEEIIKADPKFKIILSEAGDYTRAKGKEIMERFLKVEGKKINVLFAHNDDMAIGAIQAIERAGLRPAKDILTISVDGVKAAFEAMIAGKLNVSVECNPLQGPQLMQAAKDAVAGKHLPRWIKSKEAIFTADVAAEAFSSRKY